MALFKRKHNDVHSTPVFDQQVKHSIWLPIAKVLAVPLLLIAALWWFGQPAVLFQYSYQGSKSDPYYTRCLYLSLTGWQDIRPGYGDAQCPGIAFFPINIRTFLGV